jgi:hypothetical protein
VLGGGVSFGALLGLELLMQARLSATVSNRTVAKRTILVAAHLMSLPGYGLSGAGNVSKLPKSGTWLNFLI